MMGLRLRSSVRLQLLRLPLRCCPVLLLLMVIYIYIIYIYIYIYIYCMYIYIYIYCIYIYIYIYIFFLICYAELVAPHVLVFPASVHGEASAHCHCGRGARAGVMFCRVWGLTFEVWGLGFGGSGLGFETAGFETGLWWLRA